MASSDDFSLIDSSSHLHAPPRPRDTIDSTTTANNGDFFPRPFPDDPDRSPNPTRTPNTKRSSYYYKKLKPSSANPNPTTSTTEAESSSGPETASQRGDYRKDREEWSDTAIACLLEAFTEKFNQLNRGNLRGRDWEEVAEMVSERCGTGGGNKSTYKTVEQCKNKIDNLKKRYKVELQRITSSGLGASHWHWFKKLEVILGSSLVPKGGGGSDEERSSGRANSNVAKQPKRYTPGSTGFTNNLKSKSMPNVKWKRVMLKISGAALAGDCQSIDPKVATQIAEEVARACRLGVEVAIVVGGCNFFCGDTWVSSTGLDRSTAYQIGMMATVMNSVLLQSALEKVGVQARVQTALTMPEVSEPYNRLRAIRHLEKGRVVIFGGIGAGTGNYLFTTDIAAALRASELNAEAVLKGTNFNGIYECHSGSNSVTVDHTCYREVVSRGITSVDVMALTYCEENGIPVVIFNLLEPGNISRALCGDQVGTLIDQAGRIS
ncbi:uncharacterized protein LOC110763285 [Prunus avium]|uniref:UMP kinase n=1 Tax=Prunus avium TaxID=42229 RepID=A0A6P5SZB8_PRUAV|nr:uncharacterized protein LOC110763285 [Prunus avium]